MLGDGKATISAHGPVDAYTGKRSEIPNGGVVTRPAAAGSSVTVTFDLWGNGSGHFTAAADGNARLGHSGGTALSAVFGGTYTDGIGAADPISEDPQAPSNGLVLELVGDVVTLTVGPDAAYCPAEGNRHTATVSIGADATDPTQVVPSIVEKNDGDGNPTIAATFTLMVACRAASANMGAEPAPDKPLPASE